MNRISGYLCPEVPGCGKQFCGGLKPWGPHFELPTARPTPRQRQRLADYDYEVRCKILLGLARFLWKSPGMLRFIHSAFRVRQGGGLLRSVKLLLSILALCLPLPAPGASDPASASAPYAWSASVESALTAAGTNRAEISKALRQTPVEQREGMEFLVQHMPELDLTTLSAAYLLENVALAYAGFNKAPWRAQISKELFLNDILPYALLTESRDVWRKKLSEMALPLIEGCRTPTEAAQALNQKLFKLTGVHYSTKRRHPAQGPLETLQSTVATCTGLSILLVDACRAVGVPARVVGTPLWWNKRGNHTWVEIWDGDWQFTGAAEADPKGLNRGWFTHDASQALKDVPEHSIYATSFKKTGVSFPMVWARNSTAVAAVNVTDRYTPKAVPIGADKVRLLVKVLDRPAGQRVIAKVSVSEGTNGPVVAEGVSRGETADLNDILPFVLPRDRSYTVKLELGQQVKRREFKPSTNSQDLVVMLLQDAPILTMPSQLCYAPPRVTQALSSRDENRLKAALDAFYSAPPAQQATWKFSASLDRLLLANEAAVRHAAWEAYRQAPIHASVKADFDSKQVRTKTHASPYTVKEVGKRPAAGWGLVIAMHGGGGVPKEFNDRQWKHMQIYYKDHPEVGGYLYVALRAPNDSWNGFYDGYVYPLIAQLVQQFVLLGDVDQNKVFIMGYSHGGYGAFAIGPKMPDRFAAIHASAAAPSEGETTAKTLRNTVFSVMVGEKDTDHGRHDRNLRFQKSVKDLKGKREDIYPVTVNVIAGNGHGGLPDRDTILSLYPAVRNPVPRELTWLMTDSVIQDFFWIRCEAPGKQKEIGALCEDNRITVTTTTNVASASLFLDRRLVNFGRPVVVELNGKASKPLKLQPSLKILCETLLHRGDPDLAFTARLDLPLATSVRSK